MINLPEKLRIGALVYTVAIVDPLTTFERDEWGRCRNITQRIELQKDFPCPGRALETLVHEVLHAVYHAFDIPSEDADEETVVTKMAGGLAQVIIDNPALIEWLYQSAMMVRLSTTPQQPSLVDEIMADRAAEVAEMQAEGELPEE